MIFNGIADILGSFAKDYASLVVFCIFFGISYGMVGALQFEVLMAIVGTEKFSSAIGLVLLVEAIAVLVGPPGAGRLLDATKNYMYVFMLAGCEVVLSALVLAICNLLFIKRKPQQPDPPAKMEMAITETEMEELNKAPKDDQDNGGGAENEKKQAIEPETKTTSKDEVKELESIEVDSIEVENASKKVSGPNGVAVEPESSL